MLFRSSTFTREVLDGLLKIGFLHHQQIIWDKGRTVLTSWLCSYQGLGWSSSGSKPARLSDLCERHGVTNRDAHRAMPDAEALLQLLAQKNGAVSYFAQLVGSPVGG